MNNAHRLSRIFSNFKLCIAIVVSLVAICLAVGVVALLILSHPKVNTATPAAEHVTLCREMFRLHPELEIEPLGYRRLDSLDISHGFKFIAKTDDPSELLDDKRREMVEFREKFDGAFIDRARRSSWWNRPQGGGLGAGFEFSYDGFIWFSAMYYHPNGDGTLTVWAYAESG